MDQCSKVLHLSYGFTAGHLGEPVNSLSDSASILSGFGTGVTIM